MWRFVLTVFLCLSCSTLFAGQYSGLIATTGAMVLLQTKSVVPTPPVPPSPDSGKVRIVEIPATDTDVNIETKKSCGPNGCPGGCK